MKKRELVTYMDKEWEKMKDSLKLYIKKGRQKELHRFRVQVKKLQAFIILAQTTDDAPHLGKGFKPTKKIFKQGGIIRDTYLQLKQGETYGAPNSFITQKKRQMTIAAKKFRSNKMRYLPRIEETQKRLSKKTKPISNLHLEMFYEQQLCEMARQFAKPQPDKKLHICRKQLKVLIYNYKLTCPVLHTPLNTDYLDTVQKAIGNWHDNLLAAELFSELKTKDKVYRKQVNELTEDFYNRATTRVEIPIEQID